MIRCTDSEMDQVGRAVSHKLNQLLRAQVVYQRLPKISMASQQQISASLRVL